MTTFSVTGRSAGRFGRWFGLPRAVRSHPLVGLASSRPPRGPKGGLALSPPISCDTGASLSVAGARASVGGNRAVRPVAGRAGTFRA